MRHLVGCLLRIAMPLLTMLGISFSASAGEMSPILQGKQEKLYLAHNVPTTPPYVCVTCYYQQPPTAVQPAPPAYMPPPAYYRPPVAPEPQRTPVYKPRKPVCNGLVRKIVHRPRPISGAAGKWCFGRQAGKFNHRCPPGFTCEVDLACGASYYYCQFSTGIQWKTSPIGPGHRGNVYFYNTGKSCEQEVSEHPEKGHNQ